MFSVVSCDVQCDHFENPTAAMICGNHGNCKSFATQEWLDTFIAQLELPWLVNGKTDGVMVVRD